MSKQMEVNIDWEKIVLYEFEHMVSYFDTNTKPLIDKIKKNKKKQNKQINYGCGN